MDRNLDLHIAALIFMSGTQALVSGSEEGDVATTNALSLTEEDPEDPIPAPIPNIIAIPPFRPIGPTF
ncbi:MAG: hypothetical protein QF709_02640 [Candidatus Thalassarchaeum sp.]|jgi:hypothetical protein|nr:hypothetical protein [Candidatus Thalassarchaeum sp.]